MNKENRKYNKSFYKNGHDSQKSVLARLYYIININKIKHNYKK